MARSSSRRCPQAAEPEAPLQRNRPDRLANGAGGKGEFTVKDGTIHVKGGEGFLESESQHKDFVLQAQARRMPKRSTRG